MPRQYSCLLPFLRSPHYRTSPSSLNTFSDHSGSVGPALSTCPSGTFPTPLYPPLPQCPANLSDPSRNPQHGQGIRLLQQLSAAGDTPNDRGAQQCSSPISSPCRSSSERREGNSLQGCRLAGLLAEAAMAKLTGFSLSQLRSQCLSTSPISCLYPTWLPGCSDSMDTQELRWGRGCLPYSGMSSTSNNP